MEDQYQHSVNGQSVIQGDINLISANAALADDRVLAELLRLAPYDGSTVARGVLPYGHGGSGNASIVAANGASGSVLVNPFRALIGSRTAVGTDAKLNWRNIRSAIAVGTTTLAQVITHAANASGNPRWDLVYAAVAIDANGDSVIRKVKDPSSALVTGQTVVLEKVTTVTITVQAGTPAASPSWPSIPADAGGTYYIPLAYVRIPNGFGASSTVAAKDIAEAAPAIAVSDRLGAKSLFIANQHHTLGGSMLSAAMVQAWGASGTRPEIWVPPCAGGGTELIVALNLETGSESVANNGVIDSRDWRNRLVRWMMITDAAVAGGGNFGWMTDSGSGSQIPPNTSLAGGFNVTVANNRVYLGMGSTFVAAPGNKAYCFHVSGSRVGQLSAAGTVQLYADDADGGKLKVAYANAPNVKLLIWLDFSGPYGNV